ncbi:galactose mutarotase [Paenibacillus macquariensis subsp. defensor]|nr:galactose mutarotase [Paenibacillus macquariensis subsp. defensor]
MTQLTKGTWNGYDTYILHSNDLQITLLPRLGNNVIAIWDKHEERHILREPDEQDLDFYLLKPYHFGIPLLFPPGRLRNGQFSYDGVDYQFNRNTAGDNHIHGLHKTQSWCVSDIEEDEDGCSITTEFLSSDDSQWMAQSPIPLKFQVIFKLQGSRFTQQLKVTNLGEHAFPVGLGFHSWFLLNGQPQDWTLKVPVESIYELDEALIPSGELAPLGSLKDLNVGLNLAGTNLDTLFRIGEGQPVEAVLSHKDGYGLRYVADDRYFKHWVLYTKGEADEFLCIEPYTWLPNAPNLEQGPEFTGLIRLEPQQTFETQLYLESIHRP